MEPTDLIIFGGAGDLSFRKLIPALYTAHVHGALPPEVRIIGVGRRPWTRADYQRFMQEKAVPFIATSDWRLDAWQSFTQQLHYALVDAQDAASYVALKNLCKTPAQRVFYLATAPELFTPICQHVSGIGLVDEAARVVLEKPLGTDLSSAKAIHHAVAAYFTEAQVYRIDHYLGKESVQNVLTLRFENPMFEPLWRAPHVESVHIMVAESVGVGTRAGFFDGAGMVRDMVQNHMLQMLSLVAMERPASRQAQDIRAAKLQVLHALRPMDAQAIAKDTLRGQYIAAHACGADPSGTDLPCAYVDEAGVPKGSRTETFAALRCYIDNPRWQGVPFTLFTGKRLPERKTEISVVFADAQGQRSRLCMEIQPKESITWHLRVKTPGSGWVSTTAPMRLDMQAASPLRRADAYERLLLDALQGDPTHFVHGQESEAAWAWIDPVLQAWATDGQNPLPYPVGTWGPVAAQRFMPSAV